MEPRRVTLPRLGLRCELLTLAGGVWILFGAGVLLGVSNPPDGLVFAKVPAWIRGLAWILTGAWGFVSGVLSRGTTRALAALMAMPMLRFTSYWWGSLLALAPGYQAGEYPDGWWYGAIYLWMVIVVRWGSMIPPGMMRDSRWVDMIGRADDE
ncbi:MULTISPECIES: hypothetical protein [unclassified Luteococcus]|uniref:hypothetical protein n=1 Tax=unclassified Luteococcus TaxID=2639923 RepID=UPI00313F3A60